MPDRTGRRGPRRRRPDRLRAAARAGHGQPRAATSHRLAQRHGAGEPRRRRRGPASTSPSALDNRPPHRRGDRPGEPQSRRPSTPSKPRRADARSTWGPAARGSARRCSRSSAHGGLERPRPTAHDTYPVTQLDSIAAAQDRARSRVHRRAHRPRLVSAGIAASSRSPLDHDVAEKHDGRTHADRRRVAGRSDALALLDRASRARRLLAHRRHQRHAVHVDADCEHFGSHPICKHGVCVSSGLGPPGCFFGAPMPQTDFANQCTTSADVPIRQLRAPRTCAIDVARRRVHAITPTPATSGKASAAGHDAADADRELLGPARRRSRQRSSTSPARRTCRRSSRRCSRCSRELAVVRRGVRTDRRRATAPRRSTTRIRPSTSSTTWRTTTRSITTRAARRPSACSARRATPSTSASRTSIRRTCGYTESPAFARLHRPDPGDHVRGAVRVVAEGRSAPRPRTSCSPRRRTTTRRCRGPTRSYYFMRSSGTGTIQLPSRAINVDADGVVGYRPPVGRNLVASMEAVVPTEPRRRSASCRMTSPIASAATCATLAFQQPARPTATCPTRTPTSFDKANVRDGHYPFWGAVHLLAAIHERRAVARGERADHAVHACRSSIRTWSPRSSRPGSCPQCAMKVNHTSEVGALTAFAADVRLRLLLRRRGQRRDARARRARARGLPERAPGVQLRLLRSAVAARGGDADRA